jgi:hypothetical protein
MFLLDIVRIDRAINAKSIDLGLVFLSLKKDSGDDSQLDPRLSASR